MKPVTALAVIVVVFLVILGIVFWQLGLFESGPSDTVSLGEPITPTDLAGITSTEVAVITPAGQPGYNQISSAGGFGQPSASMTPVQSAAVSYIVKPGDTLWIIAQNFYNDGTRWKLIQEANSISDPSKIKAGMTLTIPDASDKSFRRTMPVEPQRNTAANSGVNSTATTTGGKYHTVVSGDNLWKLARKYYNNSAKTGLIFEANRDKLATPETTLKPGWKLLIPAVSGNDSAPKSGVNQPKPKSTATPGNSAAPANPPQSNPFGGDNVPSGMDD
jgi:nucleoid-associated protein YgaU